VAVPRLAWILVAVFATALVALLVGAALVLATESGSESVDAGRATPVVEPAEQLELPLAENPRALMLARRSGRVLVGIAALPRGPVEVAAIEGDEPVRREALTFSVDGRDVEPTPCGRACWLLDVRDPRALVVYAPAPLRFALPARALPSGTSLFRRVTRTMNRLRTLRYVEELTSGVGAGQTSTFEVRAPNRMRFRSAGGFRSIIIGRTRWDFHDGRWERSPFPGLRAPNYMWDGAGNARVLGRATHRGRSVAVLSVYDRRPVPAWFRLLVDAEDRVVDAEMLAPSHFMRQRFSSFNAPISIEPPR
jgi:hypothetical protein